jgi:hypothetical protein
MRTLDIGFIGSLKFKPSLSLDNNEVLLSIIHDGLGTTVAHQTTRTINPLLVLCYGTMDVGDDVVSIGNDIVGVRDVVANVRNRYTRIDCKLSLETDDQQWR